MKSLLTGLVALGVIGPLAVASAGPSGPRSWSSPRSWGSPFIECGGGVSGKPGVVVVHLRDGAGAQSWSLILEGSRLGPQGVEWAGKGTIRIESNASGGPWACQATAPSSFHLRSTAKILAGTTLRVLAREPVRVEIQDAQGRVLASSTVDPSTPRITAIGW